jgi:hypothetical protein
MQPNNVKAGGSRERLEVWQFYELLYPPHGIDAMGKTLRWVVPGSRLPGKWFGRTARKIKVSRGSYETRQRNSPSSLSSGSRLASRDANTPLTGLGLINRF